MKQLLEHIVKALVDEPEKVEYHSWKASAPSSSSCGWRRMIWEK